MNSIKTTIGNFLSSDKDKIIVKNIIGTFIIKGGALFVLLLTTPAYIKYFDNMDVLGIWFTILSIMSWILSFDLGLGNGLRNRLVEAFTNNKREEARSYISSAYIFFTIIVSVFIILGLIIFRLFNWNDILNIEPTIIPGKTMLYMINCVFIGISIQFVLKLITSVLYAIQKATIPNALALITSILQLVFLLTFPKGNIVTNIKTISVMYIITVNLPLLLANIFVFFRELKGFMPRLRYFSFDLSKKVIKLGLEFFWVQIMFMLITSTNEILITRLFNSSYVVEYNIYNKLFTLAGMLFTIILTPVWSAITKAYNECDIKWLNKIYKLLSKMIIISIFFELLIIPFLQLIINIWLGNEAILVNYNYAIIFGIYGSSFIIQSIFSTFACGMGKLKLQTIIYTLGVLFKFIITFILSRGFNEWIVVIIANIIIIIPYCILQPIYIKSYINKIKTANRN